jgi:hypothetical protein
MAHSVRVGVEWINRYHRDEKPQCPQKAVDLLYSRDIAEGFLMVMRSFGHEQIFDWGNDNAWQTDFDHPDFGGDSLNWSDNVHFCYFSGHSDTFHFEMKLAMQIGFSSPHNPTIVACGSLSPQWRLGAKRLKWFVLDSCQMVKDTDPNHIVEEWGGPMQGLHVLFGFIDLQWVGQATHNRRMLFANDICKGKALANAWVDTSYGWDNPGDQQHTSRPIAIAAGVSRDDAINRRENETLDWVSFDVASTNWLAWKWRG